MEGTVGERERKGTVGGGYMNSLDWSHWTGALDCMEHWTGALEYWSTGVLEHWSTGTLEHSSTGTLEPNFGATKNKTNNYNKQTNKQTNKKFLSHLVLKC